MWVWVWRSILTGWIVYVTPYDSDPDGSNLNYYDTCEWWETGF